MIKKSRTPIHPRKKQKIFERDDFKCVSCGALGDFNCLEVDHIISVVDGGSDDYSNLQTLCYKCNMSKYYKKNITNKFLLNVSPLERLDLIKNRLNDYKNLTYAEFKVVFTQDELFKRLRINLMYLEDIFREISGVKRRKSISRGKINEERNKVIAIFKKYSNKTLKELEKILKSNGIELGYPQISKICSKYSDI